MTTPFEEFMGKMTKQTFVWRMSRNNTRPTPEAARTTTVRAEKEIVSAVVEFVTATLRARHVAVPCRDAPLRASHMHCVICGDAYKWPCPVVDPESADRLGLTPTLMLVPRDELVSR